MRKGELSRCSQIEKTVAVDGRWYAERCSTECREVETGQVPLVAEMDLSKGWSFKTCVFS